jgi:hypothetical protein
VLEEKQEETPMQEESPPRNESAPLGGIALLKGGALEESVAALLQVVASLHLRILAVCTASLDHCGRRHSLALIGRLLIISKYLATRVLKDKQTETVPHCSLSSPNLHCTGSILESVGGRHHRIPMPIHLPDSIFLHWFAKIGKVVAHIER